MSRSLIIRRPGDKLRLYETAEAARRFGLARSPPATVLYHSPDRRMLQDVVTAIRNKCTIDDLGFRRERFADRHLKGPAEMARRFADHPDAIAATAPSPSAAPSACASSTINIPTSW
jgi:error-prone DNA polymerase